MHPVRNEIRILSRYAAPLILTQVGMMVPGIVDMWMVGKLGPDALAAVALGDLWLSGTVVVALGVLLGIDPLVSQGHGAGDSRRVALALQRGIVLAFVITVPLTLLWLLTEDLLLGMDQRPVLADVAGGYVRIQIFSVAPRLIFIVLRQYLHGRGIMMPVLWVMIAANLANVFGDWVLIFGNLGCPALGIDGAGIATGLTQLVMMGGLLGWILVFRLHRGAWIPWSRAVFSLRGMWHILTYGLPVGTQIGLEVWAFILAGLLAGKLGSMELASHTIVIRLASLSFMVPLGISIASVTRVGNLIGRGQQRRAQTAAWVAVFMGAGVMLFSAISFTLLRRWLPAQFTSDPAVIGLSASILPIAAAFQLFDGTQVVGCGVLRGMGNTVPAAVFNLVGYYLLALPLGYSLTFPAGVGLAGIWWGLCLGLGSVAILVLLWIWKRGPRVARPVRDLESERMTETAILEKPGGFP